MQVQRLSANKSRTFKSGLNQKILAESKTIAPQLIESKMLLTQGIEANFNNRQVNAFVTQKAVEILNFLKEKTGLNIFRVGTPSIHTYVDKNLVFPFIGYGFCVPETQSVLKDKPYFKTGAIFYPEENLLEELDFKTDVSFNNGERSSSHFLAPVFHEIFHEKYIDYIYKKYGYEGECSYTREKYSKESPLGLQKMKCLEELVLDSKENKIVKNILGNYATEKCNQYHEVFAETFTKITCESLDKDSNPIMNPLLNLKKLPDDFLKVLNKILTF